MKKGRWAEKFVLRDYLNRGFELIDRNVICNRGEIDLIFTRNNLLVFVEVRLLSSSVFMHPIESIDSRKLRILRRACQFYFVNSWNKDCDYTLEIATVSGSLNCPKLEIWPDAFNY